ncbi:MAG: ABC transporter ATP-binding protein [Roseiflexaceae bacterium]|nr:ABC transporter ATP-binding protein [Roseiflexaceae bacterium]
MTKVELIDVVKQYDAIEDVTLTGYRNPPALNHVTMTIEDGETISIVGPSGCGKSTLLKVVAGLEYPNSGRVLYNGQDFTEIKPQERGVGFVFQDYALYPTKKGKGNLQYFFEVRKRSEAEQEAQLKATAELMGVDFDLLLGQMPDTLSGGQKQRVAIARCIVRDPNLFLMDEPIVNLDAKLRERTRIEIKKLLKQFAITTLYVTHDQQEAIFMGDRICVMRHGVIEQLGSFDDLYYTPANLFVASFIGTPPMSVLPAVVEGALLVLGEHRWNLPAALAGQLPPGPVRLGVRPEGWLLDAPDGASMQVRHVERIPTERASFLIGSLYTNATIVLAALDHPHVTQVQVTPDWERAYIFDAESEAALWTPSAPDLF